MFKLDNAFLEELGLGSLPAVEKNKMLAHIYETLEMRVGMKLAEQMSNEQLDEFESYINKQDEAGALKWLESNFPNYKQVVAEELERLKGEVRQVAPQVVAQAAKTAPVAQNVQGQNTAIPAPFPALQNPQVGQHIPAQQPQNMAAQQSAPLPTIPMQQQYGQQQATAVQPTARPYLQQGSNSPVQQNPVATAPQQSQQYQQQAAVNQIPSFADGASNSATPGFGSAQPTTVQDQSRSEQQQPTYVAQQPVSQTTAGPVAGGFQDDNTFNGVSQTQPSAQELTAHHPVRNDPFTPTHQQQVDQNTSTTGQANNPATQEQPSVIPQQQNTFPAPSLPQTPWQPPQNN